jgi:hypothetical protein
VAENHKLDVGKVNAVFRELLLPMGLLVDVVEVEAEGLHFETEPFQASVRQPGSFEVFVGERSLAKFLNQKAPAGIKNFEIEAVPTKLNVTATVKMIIELGASAVCTLRIVDQRFLYVDLESVNVMGAGATSLVSTQLEKINPVLDVEEFPVRATLDEVHIVEGGVRLKGTVAPP